MNSDELSASNRCGAAAAATSSTPTRLHSIISTPYLEGDYVYGVDSYGEFRCLDAKTGDRIWESLEPTPKSRWSTIHMVKNNGRMWMFNERGELVIATLSPQGYSEISRAKLIEPTRVQLGAAGRRLLVASGLCRPACVCPQRRRVGLRIAGSRRELSSRISRSRRLMRWCK